jgi:cyclophilin family peptidyl-prolyl cis-trans isomerase
MRIGCSGPSPDSSLRKQDSQLARAAKSSVDDAGSDLLSFHRLFTKIHLQTLSRSRFFSQRRLLVLIVTLGLAPLAWAAPVAPTNCVAVGIGDTSGGASIVLAWNDNSSNETAWIIEYTIGGGGSQFLSSASETGSGTGPIELPLNAVANNTYGFRIYAYDGLGYSAPSNWTSVSTGIFALTQNRVNGQLAISLSWPNIQNESGYRIIGKEVGAEEYSVLGSVTANVTGYQVSASLIEASKTYSFIVQPIAGGSIVGNSNVVIVRPPPGAPLVGTAIPAWTGAVGSNRSIPLADAFSDPEAESAVRVSTTLGNMDFILFNSATPATVENFMDYVIAGKYSGVVFHRSIASFVIQGGGFKGAGTGSNFTSVVTLPPVVNEPGVANEFGTVSMAKLGGDPNSATSQFFISLGDNRSNLDYQNGGFTVFGRVAGNGMSVAEAIAALPTGTYNLFLNGSATATQFTDFPMNSPTFPVPIDQTKLVRINSVTPIATLGYSISGNTDPSVASATVVDGQLHLVAFKGGRTIITVTATDLDNLTASQSVEVIINETFADWASRVSFSDGTSGYGQNPDGDAWNNLQEFAFLGDPLVASAASSFVYSGTIGEAPSSRFLTMTFPVRKFTQGLIYAVEANNSLDGVWEEIWNSGNGFNHPQVITALDQVDRTLITIKDVTAIGSVPKRFLRTKLVNQEP